MTVSADLFILPSSTISDLAELRTVLPSLKLPDNWVSVPSRNENEIVILAELTAVTRCDSGQPFDKVF